MLLYSYRLKSFLNIIHPSDEDLCLFHTASHAGGGHIMVVFTDDIEIWWFIKVFYLVVRPYY